MVTVSVDEMRHDLEKVLAQAESGEDVIVTRDGKAVAKVASIPGRNGLRAPGWGKGLFPEGLDLEKPLPDDIREALGG
jgi:prevent-host-death family protein